MMCFVPRDRWTQHCDHWMKTVSHFSGRRTSDRSELDLLLVLTAWYIRSRGSCSSVMLVGRNWKCYYRLHSVNILRTTMKNASHFRTAYKETDKRKMWRDARGFSVGGCTIGPE